MMGYLATVVARELAAGSGQMHRAREPHAPPNAETKSGITPRLPSLYESWAIGAYDEAGFRPRSVTESEVKLRPAFEGWPVVIRDARPSSPPRGNVETPVGLAEAAFPSATEPDSPVVTSRPSKPMRGNSVEPPNVELPGVSDSARRPGPSPAQTVVSARLRSEPIDPLAVAHAKKVEAPRADERRVGATETVWSQVPVLPNIREPAPVRARRRESRPETEAPHAAASPEISAPPVVVTIGRIEVRALTPPSAPRSSREARPLMSLDDYLQQRVRGVR